MKKNVRRFALFSILTLFSLTSCTPEKPLTDQDFLSKLIPSWVSFVAQILALVVLVVVVIIFAYKPVKKIIKTRQDYIEDNIKDSENAKKVAEQNVNQSEELLIASNKKANEIISDAKKEAMNEREKIINETNQIISKMKTDAEKEILQAEEDAKANIQKEMVDVAILTSSEILKRNVKDEDNEKLAEDFIKDLDK